MADGIARLERPSFYGNDGETLSIGNAPDAVFTPEFSDLLTELSAREDNLRQQSREADDENEKADLYQAAKECEQQIADIKHRAKNMTWTADEKAKKGVVVYLDRDGEPCVVRGVIDLEQQVPQCSEDESTSENWSEQSTASVETVSTYSAALCKSLSSERTLAVQAALTQHPNVALVIVVHDMCLRVFGKPYVKQTLGIALTLPRAELLKNASTAQESPALIALNQQHEIWLSKFPADWQDNFTWLLTWEMPYLLALLAYCTAQTLDGVNHSIPADNKVALALQPVEQVIRFDFRQWWQPTKANFFGRISKDQISDCLAEAGASDKALEAVKMKKGDAAELAENTLKESHWLPSCFVASSMDTHTDNANVQ